MDGHWEWSESGSEHDGEPDTGDTADLGGDLGGDPGYGQGFEHTFDQGHTFGGDPGDGAGDAHGDAHGDGQGYGPGFEGAHDDFGGGDPLGGAGHGGDDLEEPLGTEHAAETYDQSVHDGDGDHTGHPGGGSTGADGDPAQHAAFEPVADHDTGDNGHIGHTGDGDGDGGDAHTGAATDVDGDGNTEHPAETFGTDPDLHGHEGWPGPLFPEELHLDSPPEPVDGFPWSDADVLGGPDHSLSAAYDPAVHTDPANPADLAGYDGADLPDGADPWSLLLHSDDPATSSLAGFWAPQN